MLPLEPAARRAVRERYGMEPRAFGYVGRLV
jgi:hypothetical protein